MAFLSFGKRVKNQKFNYIPRHYDPAKEEMKDRLRMASEESNAEISKMRIRDGFRRKARGNKELERTLKRNANIRLLVIVAILIGITYAFMTSDGLMKFIEKMSG